MRTLLCFWASFYNEKFDIDTNEDQISIGQAKIMMKEVIFQLLLILEVLKQP